LVNLPKVLVKVKQGFYFSFRPYLGVLIHMVKYICNKAYKILVLSALPFTVAAMQPKPAQAVQISQDNFGSGAIVESFEGLSPGLNLTLQGNDVGLLNPGVIEPFTFESGVTLTGSVIGVLIGDWSIGRAYFGLGENGFVDSAADVPDGSAYLAINFGSVVEFTFPSDILRVGGLVTSSALNAGDLGSPINLSAFDEFGTLLETVTIPNVNVSDWGSNFLGLENAAGIRRVTFSPTPTNVGSYLVLDRLTFEPISSPSIAVPEPTSGLGVLVCAVLGASSMLKRRQVNVK
jgi:hypothetical protein